MTARRFLLLVLLALRAPATELRYDEASLLALPQPGDHGLLVLSPTVLELTLITTKPPDPARPAEWDFVSPEGELRLPKPEAFESLADGKSVSASTVGFKRRVLYAPLRKRDLRIANEVYLQLAQPVGENQTVEVRNPGFKTWPATLRFVAKADPRRISPAIHVNQVGYLPGAPKTAMVGYFLGSLGELELTPGHAGPTAQFTLVRADNFSPVFTNALRLRPDKGWAAPVFQQVWEADFTAFDTPGEYRVLVPGLGASLPFFIDTGIAAAFARTYALGIYHQRCGVANELPFTRFTHGSCHVAPAEVPTSGKALEFLNRTLAGETAEAKRNPRHTAPAMTNLAACLYSFVNRGPVDTRGGHHDAGDYSKYTINSAQFIHHLVFAVDVFPGVADLDNLGLPESGDGKSDILQEAKWEADFLAKLQDDDGGFYFLVYPRQRRYELDVLPDHGDAQVVWPKTTAATAAAVAALAQCASSPKFKTQFPEAAALYLEKARRGWAFLERAIAAHGKDGAYQRITHYGDEFMHDDELAWAACELFLATGEAPFRERLLAWLKPDNPTTRKWTWWRLFEANGCAIRSYAFAVESGRLPPEKLEPALLASCRKEIEAAGLDQLHRAEANAYGTSLPEENKRFRTAGWYFSGDPAFDLAVAMQLPNSKLETRNSKLHEAVWSNLSYEAGCNPVNVTFVTGLGWRRQHEIAHQFALNDRRTLPPSGIPLGNLQAAFGWLDLYQRELNGLSFPADDDAKRPYPLYDRWGDTFNLSTEFVIVNQARALGYTAWLMAQSPVKTQAWRSAEARIAGLPEVLSAGTETTLRLEAPASDLRLARVVWEASGTEPRLGEAFKFTPAKARGQWVEAEAQWPDGRRVFGVTNVTVR